MPATGEVLSLLSGLFQAVGYFLYVRGTLRHEIVPNPTTWLLFAYDTTLLVLLHTTLGADPLILLLPAVCASCSIGVAALSWARLGFYWPDEGLDQAAVVGCLGLTVGYAALTVLADQGAISSELRRGAYIAMLVFSNGSTIVSFVPLLRSMRRHPASERPAAWLVWAVAYGLLLASTMLIHKWSEPELVLYPICNMTLHLAVAGLSLPARRHLATTVP